MRWIPDDRTEITGSVDTVVEDERWTDLDKLARRACCATLEHLGLVVPDYEIVVLGADDARISALNGQFRGRPGPTNVLSWPSAERAASRPGRVPVPPERGELGDIALAWETCVAEAMTLGRDFDSHVTHLLVHGALHLLGYDHETEADARLMERTEIEVLALLGIPDPYSVSRQ